MNTEYGKKRTKTRNKKSKEIWLALLISDPKIL